MKFVLLATGFLLSFNSFALQKTSSKLCSESSLYDSGFNQGKLGKDLKTPPIKSCSPKEHGKLIEAYHKGYKEGFALKQEQPAQVIVNGTNDSGYIAPIARCSDYKKSKASCFTSYEGDKRAECDVCRENKSCFMELTGKAQSLCAAYREKKSCFVALSDHTDLGWCEHLRDGKSCEDAFGISMSDERARCEDGEIPKEHFFWMN